MSSMWRAAASALALAGASAAEAERYPKVAKSVVFSPGEDHRPQASSLILVNRPDGARGVRKVVIPFFQIQFVVDSDTSANVSGGASSKMMVHLEGPTPQQMQAITDRLYARLVSDLTAAGVTVVASADAQRLAAYGKLLANAKPSGSRVEGHQGVNSLFFAPTGMPFYFLPTMDVAYTGAGSFGGFSTAMLPPKEQALMEEAGAAVLGFRAVVDFASLKSSDNALLGHFRSRARTSAEAGIAIRPIATQLWMMTPQAKPMVTDMQNRLRFELQAPLLVETDAITAMTDARTGGDKASEVAGRAMAMLLGGGMSKVRKYQISVDPDIWARDVEASLQGVETMMIERLKTEL